MTRGAVSQWRQVAAEYVVRIEEATGIPREALRPDLYRRSPRKPRTPQRAA